MFGRVHRHAMLLRTLTPIKGTPRITVRCKPSFEYNSRLPVIEYGTAHVKYVGAEQTIRLTSDISCSYILKEVPFLLREEQHFVLCPDEPLTRSLTDIIKDFKANTEDFWTEWCKYVNLPFEYQKHVLRASLILRISAFDDTGAIPNALTSSIPF